MSQSLSVIGLARPIPRRKTVGFTLIEVLVSLIILSIGLLGLGLLQASSLKSGFSADQRTVATNLAYQMVDMMRANRRLAFRYAYIDMGDALPVNPTTCDRQPVTIDVVDDDTKGWLCQLVRALPNGDADVAYAAGAVTVTIIWTDARWFTGPVTNQQTTFVVTSQL